MRIKTIISRAACSLFLLLTPVMAKASHGTNPVSDIDYTGMGNYSGNYNHSNTDHVWVIFNANAGDVITMNLNTGFQQHYWLYRSNNGCVQVGNAAPGCMTLVQNGGNGVSNGIYSYAVTVTGQYAFQLDAYVGQSGSYNMTISGSTATTVLCSPTGPAFTSCPGNQAANTSAGNCTAVVNYTATATSGTMTYSKTGATTGSGAGTGSGTSFNKGTTTVTVTATSTSTCGGSGSTSCTFDVTVTDGENPTITAPSDVSASADAGMCSASGVALGSANAADNCAGVTVGNDAPSPLPIGTTLVTWTATDAAGNTATATQNVTITDDEDPTISAPSDITLATDADLCSSTGSIGNVTAADNCSTPVVPNDAPSPLPTGTTVVTWTATDASGNTATATQNVTVADGQNPTITAPADVTVEGYCEDAPADLGTPTTDDNCGVASVTNDAPSLFPVGTTTVTWTVTDANGNSATAEQNVTVNSITLSISGTTTDVSCNGGSDGAIDITVNNGTSPYGYSWSNGATTEDISGLSAGSYTVNVTDDRSCTGTANYTISEPTSLTGSISVSPNPTVSGQQAYTIFLGYGPQSVTLAAAGADGTPGYTYLWSTGATTSTITVSPTTTTVYSVTITDANGCSTTVTQQITVKDVRNGNKIFVCHIPPGNPGNANTLSVSSNAVAAHLGHGDNLGACNSTARNMNNGLEGMEEVAEALHFHVYPNPTSGMFTVELPQTGTTTILITDIAGRVVVQQNIKDNTQQELQFNLGSEAKGLYFIKVVNGGDVYQSKITLQ